MSILEALILGIIQGLTEFLPVSSSGHLELAKAVFANKELPEEGLLFTIVVHAATAFSTIVVFRKDIGKIFADLFKFKYNEGARYSFLIVLSMIPAAAVGYFFEEKIETLFTGRVMLVGCMLIVTGILLYITTRLPDKDNKTDAPKAFLVGLAQAIAIMPGISRSGATISTGLILGMSRAEAARFSFLMVLPLILGAMAMKTQKLIESGNGAESLMPIAVGFIAAFVSGVLACRWMIALVKRSKLIWFAVYCFVAGIIAIIVGF